MNAFNDALIDAYNDDDDAGCPGCAMGRGPVCSACRALDEADEARREALAARERAEQAALTDDERRALLDADNEAWERLADARRDEPECDACHRPTGSPGRNVCYRCEQDAWRALEH